MITLSKEQVKRLHKIVLDNTGGLDGIHDEALLDSALAAPFQTFGGLELYHIDADFSDNDVIRIGLELAQGNMTDKQLLEIILERSL